MVSEPLLTGLARRISAFPQRVPTLVAVVGVALGLALSGLAFKPLATEVRIYLLGQPQSAQDTAVVNVGEVEVASDLTAESADAALLPDASELDPATIRARILSSTDCGGSWPIDQTLANLRQTALRLMRERRFREAASVLDQVLVIDPDDAPASVLRALLDMAI